VLLYITQALRHSKVKLTWDDDDPERNKVTRRRMTRKEVEEGDFRGLLASSSEEDEDSSNEAGPSKLKDRERMRELLLGGDNDELPEGWGQDGKDKSGDLEITFMPALSSNAPKDEEEETTLDRYKRKQKEKRAQRKAKQDLSTNEDKESHDDFFGDDGDPDPISESPGPRTSSKLPDAKLSNPTTAPRNVSTDAELELLLAPDPTVATSEEPKHFDMRAVIKAEKASRSGKKGRRRDKKNASSNAEVEDGRDFQIDVKDERFAALHEDYAFAIDPSNPQ
jgi:hypothetical protein